MSDSMLTAFFIILSGGLQDAYTYCCRGKVFANAQTGNIVLLSTHLFEGDWGQALRYLVPVLAFLLGISLSSSQLVKANPANNKEVKIVILVFMAYKF